MRHITYAQSDTYPVALLIKASAFNVQEIRKVYIDSLVSNGIPEENIVVISLDYNDKGKAPVKFIKEYLDVLMPQLESVGTQYIYCADANYFKVLAGQRKAEPYLGYLLPCKLEGCSTMMVTLGVNHKSLIYNPANEPKLDLSINTLLAAWNNNYEELGTGIIKHAEYPSTVEAIKAALDKLHQYPNISADIEAFSLDFDKAGVGTMTFCWNKHEGIAFACDYEELPVRNEQGHFGKQVKNSEVQALIRDFLENYKGTIKWHNSPYDMSVLIYELWMKDFHDTPGLLRGLEILTRSFHDTKIIAYLATNTTAGNELSLKVLAHPYAGNWSMGDDIKDIRKIPLRKLLEYNLIDGLSTEYTFEQYYPVMVNDLQEEMYFSLMLPSQKTITQIELTGMPLDPDKVLKAEMKLVEITSAHRKVIADSLCVQELNKRLRLEEMVKANAKLKVKQHPLSAFDHIEFNPGSDPQLRKLLYEDMALPILDRTKTRLAATGGETLDKLKHHTKNQEYKHVIEALIGLSTADKILTSFIPAFKNAVEKGDDVVWLHGNFNLGGTVSGRLSSSNPNLQNIPSGSVYGKLIKSCFISPKGWIFCGADFNSLEDYISALTTRDPNKLKVYEEGYDGHCLRAYSYFPARLPGIVDTVESINSISEKFGDVRQESKAPTFALTYQGTHRTLMKNLGFSEDVALAIEDNYHKLYEVSDAWVQARLDEASQKGFVELAFGHRLRTPLLAQTLRGKRSTPREAEAEGRTAGNALGQSYGLLNNRAVNDFMQKVWASPYRYDIKPIALIHDAIYLIIRDDIKVLDWVNRELIKSMQWQELPEIQHDTVKLGAELSVFWPDWAHSTDLPNNAEIKEIRKICLATKTKIIGEAA